MMRKEHENLILFLLSIRDESIPPYILFTETWAIGVTFIFTESRTVIPSDVINT